MKYIIDAQLPFSLKHFLEFRQIDALHVLEVDATGRLSDIEICKLAEEQNRIVITKDIDFLDSFLLFNLPKKLFLISTGNISNKQLLTILQSNIQLINQSFKDENLIELTNNSIIVH